MTLFRPSTVLPALVAAGLLVSAAQAVADEDHERARRAFESGEIVSLSSILDRVERDFEGDLLEVELEDEDGRAPAYEVKLLAPGGTIVELLFDARSGELLRLGNRDLDRLGRQDEDDEDDEEDDD